MNAAAISGDYTDLKFIRTRKVCQVVIEIPMEQASAFIAAFGAPRPDGNVPVALAKLDMRATQSPPADNQPKGKKRSRAQEAGILIGDIFVEVDGVDVIGLSQLELAALVGGEKRTRVTIVMLRGDQRVTFEMTRARIEIPNVESEIVDNNIAYVKLNQFSAEARGELEQAITALDVNRRAGLIVDFRDNPGGLLSSAIEVASAFIPDGPVVIEDFGDGEERVFNANQDALDIHVPIILLVNEASASASELVAGALQDTERATILGETTVGKGAVQPWNSLANGGGVRLTIARWLTPNRSWIHEVGITPDVVVEWTPQSDDDANDPQLDAAIYRLTAKVRQAHLQSIPYPAVQVD